jgi:hypothetical protein
LEDIIKVDLREVGWGMDYVDWLRIGTDVGLL